MQQRSHGARPPPILAFGEMLALCKDPISPSSEGCHWASGDDPLTANCFLLGRSDGLNEDPFKSTVQRARGEAAERRCWWSPTHARGSSVPQWGRAPGALGQPHRPSHGTTYLAIGLT